MPSWTLVNEATRGCIHTAAEVTRSDLFMLSEQQPLGYVFLMWPESEQPGHTCPSPIPTNATFLHPALWKNNNHSRSSTFTSADTEHAQYVSRYCALSCTCRTLLGSLAVNTGDHIQVAYIWKHEWPGKKYLISQKLRALRPVVLMQLNITSDVRFVCSWQAVRRSTLPFASSSAQTGPTTTWQHCSSTRRRQPSTSSSTRTVGWVHTSHHLHTIIFSNSQKQWV